MKRCEVYVRNEAYYIFPQSVTTFGIGIASEPMLRLDRQAQPKALGETVLKALNTSQQGAPHPSDLREVTKMVLRTTGFKTWNAFAKDARYLSVVHDGAEVEITPYTSAARGAFDVLPEKARKCPPEPEEIGQLLLTLLKEAK